jgi:NAD-dependent SIR2 family protein deacetylase
MQHELRHSLLSRWRRQLETNAAGPFPGVHGGGVDAPTLLGAQHDRLAPVRAGLPNDAHYALARLEAQNRCRLLLTQNVDRLHQAAGSRAVIDLHGRLDLVRCTACSATTRRADFQSELGRLNADWISLDATALPDGDADLDNLDFSEFAVPACGSCGGIQKPDVVFFGESVPRDQVAAAQAALEEADAMLVVGSSLMVYSGFRFAQMAAHRGMPIAAVNLGRTRADDLLDLKVEDRCEAALSFLL